MLIAIPMLVLIFFVPLFLNVMNSLLSENRVSVKDVISVAEWVSH
jgi:hypothetical protein